MRHSYRNLIKLCKKYGLKPEDVAEYIVCMTEGDEEYSEIYRAFFEFIHGKLEANIND